MTNLVEGSQTYWQLLGAALSLHATGFTHLLAEPDALKLALLTVFVAGIATVLGQGVVLFINRVKPLRSLLTIVLGSSFYTLGFLFFAVSSWLMAKLLFGVDTPLVAVVTVVGLAYAPLLFNFLAFIPYWGLALSSLLQLWSWLAILVGGSVVLELGLLQMLAASGLGFIALQLTGRTIGFPLALLVRRLRAWTAGVPDLRDTLEPHDLIQEALTSPRQRFIPVRAAAKPRSAKPSAGQRP